MAIRRWRVWSIVLAAALMPAALAHGAGVPAGCTPADFETADARQLAAKVSSILGSLPPVSKVQERDAAATAVADQFTAAGVGINSKRAEARLNAAILIANLGTLDSDHPLEEMLKNSDAAVRYYGAKGLGMPALAASEKSAAAPTGGVPVDVIKKLADAAKKETSNVVQEEIIKTLIVYEGAGALVDAVDTISAQMQSTPPEAGTLQMAAQALNVVTSKIGSLTAAEKAKIPVVAVNSASYAVQQYRVAEKMAKEESKDVPQELTAATLKLVDAAAKAAGAALGKAIKIDVSSVDSAELDLNLAFGTPDGAGKIPGVPAPKAIKTGG